MSTGGGLLLLLKPVAALEDLVSSPCAHPQALPFYGAAGGGAFSRPTPVGGAC